MNQFIKNICGKTIFFQAIALMFLAFVAATAQFYAIQHLGAIIDAVEKGYAQTVYHFLIIMFCFLLYIIFSAVFTLFGGQLAARFAYSIRTKIGRKLCFSDYQAVELVDHGKLLAIITKDIEAIKNWLIAWLKLGYLPAYLGLSSFYLFQWCNWKFAFLILCLIPFSAITNTLITRKLPLFYENEKEAYAKVLTHFTASIQFEMLVKSFQLEKIFKDKHRDELNHYVTARKKRILYEKCAEQYDRCYGHISRIFILLLGAYFILIGDMTLGRLVNVTLLVDFVGEGLKLLGSMPGSLRSAKVSAARTQELLDLPIKAEPQNEISSERLPGTLPVYEVHNLSFSYKNAFALRGINFRVNAGEKIAVVGRSGCGKTTLFKLLSRLYMPEKNQIYVYGRDITALSSEYLKSMITATTQEAFLFQSTLRDNIKIAKHNGTDDEIEIACKNAQMDSFICSLPHGYDTEVNTTVSPLSNGQAQRINLARAFLKDTGIFLLDEPTSALDTETAGFIWNFLFSDCSDKTLLVILHDLEEAYRFDKILVLDDGKQSAFGSHDELMQNCQLYQTLYKEKMANRKGGT